MMYLLLYSFLYTVCFNVVSSDKIFFSCISMSSSSYIQGFFSKVKPVKTFSHTQLKQTNLEIQLHIFTESPKKDISETDF